MKAMCKGYLLDENSGNFVNDRGESIDYHNARFYNLDERRIFKASVPKDCDALPEEQIHCVLSFEVAAGEKFCRISYSGFQPLPVK